MSKNQVAKSANPDNKGVVKVESHSIYVGPIPSADELVKYQQILSSAPERIIKMAEKQQIHQHQTIEKVINSDIAIKSKGQIFGFFIVTLVLCFSGFAMYLDYATLASAGLVSALVPLVKIFFLNYQRDEKKPD